DPSGARPGIREPHRGDRARWTMSASQRPEWGDSATISWDSPTTAGPGPAAVPAAIGPYRAIERLGRGRPGEPVRALHPLIPGPDARAEGPRPGLAPRVQAKTLDEARILARLRVEGLARVHDAGVHDGRPFVVLDYVEGLALGEWIRHHRSDPRRAARL